MVAKKAVKKSADVLKSRIAAAVSNIPEKPVVKAAPAVEKPIEPKAYVVIDFPVQNDKIRGPHYAMKIGASAGIVEIQINSSSWMSCRHNSGYWWFDWVNFAPGKYKITARLKDNNDKIIAKSTILKVEAL